MTNEQFELCSTIARGMRYAANQNPDKIFKLGIKASIEQKRTNLPKKNKSNVIDFLKYLKIEQNDPGNKIS